MAKSKRSSSAPTGTPHQISEVYKVDHRIILPPEQDHIEKYYHYARAFSEPECEKLIEIAEVNGFSEGSIGIGKDQKPYVDTNYRMVSVSRIIPEQAPWAFDRVRDRCEWVNKEYRFDVHGLYEDIGIMRYDEAAPDSPAGHYNWHQDFGGGPYARRKISVVALLSPPDLFEGGDLLMFADKGEERMSLNQQGDMVVFPSWAPHCVTPVNRGRRYSLVAWVSGPRFR